MPRLFFANLRLTQELLIPIVMLRGAIVELVKKRVADAGALMAEAKQNGIELKNTMIRSLILVASSGLLIGFALSQQSEKLRADVDTFIRALRAA
jgi:hypothetical protein